MFEIEDYSYKLPESAIAQVPTVQRDGSRLMVVDRQKRTFSDNVFYDLPGLLRQGDLLVVNDTRVVPSRLFGRKDSGGKVEILVLGQQDPADNEPDTRWCLLRSSKRSKKGTVLFFGTAL